MEADEDRHGAKAYCEHQHGERRKCEPLHDRLVPHVCAGPDLTLLELVERPCGVIEVRRGFGCVVVAPAILHRLDELLHLRRSLFLLLEIDADQMDPGAGPCGVLERPMR